MRPPKDEMDPDDGESETLQGASEGQNTYVAIADYAADSDATEDLSLHEGQLVEVLDSHNSQKWLVRTKSTPPEEGWVPSSFLERRGKPGLEKKDSRELTKEASHHCLTREEEALVKRETVLDELIETEKEFIRSLKFAISTYVEEFDNPHVPESLRTLRDELFVILKEILTFHEVVLLSGLQYVGDVAKVGKTFLRLERDFDKHVAYCRDEPEAQTLLASTEAQGYLQQFSQRIGDTDQTLSDYLKLPIQRINKYQLLLKELIKYTARAKEDCSDFQKALDLMMSIPQRAHDLTYLNSVEGYRGNIQKLGRLLRHDSFVLWEKEAKGPGKERYLFLFRDRILVTKKEGPLDMPDFVYKDTIKLAEVSLEEQLTDDEKRFEFIYYPEYQKPSVVFQAKTPYIKQAWIKEMKELLRTGGGLAELEVVEEKTPIIIMEITNDEDLNDPNNTDSTEFFMAPEYEDGTTRPRFKKTTEKVTCIEGEVVRFDCKVAGKPKPSVTWLKGGRPIEASDKYVFVQEEETHIFYIKSTVLDDAGYYKARALNINGAISFKAELVVVGGDLKRMIVKRPSRPCTPLGVPIEEDVIPKRPFFEHGMKSMGVQAGESAKFNIKVSGYPEPEIKWQRSRVSQEKGRLSTSQRYHEKEELRHNEKFRIIRDSEETATLIIENVSVDDAGRYFCEAINELGSTISQGQLNVEGSDSLMMKYDSDYKEELIEVERGEILKIEVGFDGSPMPKASWMCNNKLLCNTERVTIEVVENVARLVINNTEDSDAGTYTLILETDIEKVTIPIIVNVVEPPPGKVQSIRKTESLKKIETFESIQSGEIGNKDFERYDSITTSEKVERMDINDIKSSVDLSKTISQKEQEIMHTIDDSEIVEILKEYEIINGLKESQSTETTKEAESKVYEKTISGVEKISEIKEAVKDYEVIEKETGKIRQFDRDETLEMDEDFDRKETDKDFEIIETEREIRTKKLIENFEPEDDEAIETQTKIQTEIVTKRYIEDFESLEGEKGSELKETIEKVTKIEKEIYNEDDEVVHVKKEFEYRKIFDRENEDETIKFITDIESVKHEDEEEIREYEVIEKPHTLESRVHELEKKDNETLEIEQRFEIEQSLDFDEIYDDLNSLRHIKTIQKEYEDLDDLGSHFEKRIDEKIIIQKTQEPKTKEILSEYEIKETFSEYKAQIPEAQVISEMESIQSKIDSQVTVNEQDFTEVLEQSAETISKVDDRNEDYERQELFDYSFEKKYKERKIGPPGPPTEFQVIDTSPESITLRWRPPKFDGGSMIYGYIIEKRGVGRHTWNKACVSKELSCTVHNLLEDNEYQFSVQAENEYGLGDRAETLPVIAKYPFGVPEPPSQPRVQMISSNSSVLIWEPPENDGGSPVLGYYAERRHNYSPQWIKMNREIVVDCVYNVTDMIKNANYEFRIIAVNKAGESIPGVASLPLKAVAPLEDVNLDDIIKKEGPSFKQELTGDKVPPSYTLDEIYLDVVHLAKGETLKLQAHIAGNPAPKATWSFGENRITDSYTVTIDTTRERTTLKVRNINKSDSGSYTLYLENEAGKAEALFMVQVLDTPGPPKNIKVVEGTDDSVTLAWEPPDDDGGAVIEGYLIEKRGIGRRTWQKVQTVPEIIFTVPNLVEGNDYEFRITAENMYGLGEPMEMKKMITVRYTFYEPGPPTNPTILRVMADSVILTWQSPVSDGGSPILGYYIERRQGISPRWIRISRDRILDTLFEITGLQTGEEYEFRVIAENKAGESRPSMPTDQIIIMDQPEFYQDDIISELISSQTEEEKQILEEIRTFEEANLAKDILESEEFLPEAPIQVPPKCIPKFDTISIENGETLEIDVEIEGIPSPKVYWYLNGKQLLESYRITIEKTEVSSLLVVREVTRNDAGEYKIALESTAGRSETVIKVKVLDVPDSPTNLRVKEITNDSATLQWQPPKFDGDAEVIGYLVEKRGSGRRLFQKVSTTKETTFTVPDLIEDNFYDLQVTAINKYGSGKPSEIGPIRIKFTFTAPAEVEAPIVERVTGTTAVIHWKAPVDNGGTILGYHVECRSSISPRWIRITKERINNTRFEATGLMEGEEYEFRIIAENKAGESRPGEPCEPIIAFNRPEEPVQVEVKDIETKEQQIIEEKRITQETIVKREISVQEVRETSFSRTEEYKVEEETTAVLEESIISEEAIVSIQPSPPVVQRITATSALLTWQPSPSKAVLGYHVEMRKGIEQIWIRISKERLSNTSFIAENLEVDEEYQFRIIAETELGPSKPSEPSQPIKAKETFVEQTKESISIRDQVEIEQTTEVLQEAVTMEEALQSIQPSPPIVHRISSTSALLTWQAPPNKAVLGYHIEQRKGIETVWIRITKERLSDTSYLVENLEEDEEYQFRIISVTELGESKPSQASQPTKAKETIVEKMQTLVAETEETKVLVHTKEEKVEKMQTLVAETEETKVIVHTKEEKETAGSPSKPLVSDVTAETAVISWEAPLDDGGSPVTGYYVEKRSGISPRWIRVTKEKITATSYKVTDLIEGEQYQFRVVALNKAGEGEPSEPSESIIARNPEEEITEEVERKVLVVPGSPSRPIVTNITQDSATLKWQAPIDNGGVPILEYFIEQRTTKETTWKKLICEKITVTSYQISKLEQNEIYEFRIIAVNQIGQGTPSEPSEAFTVLKPAGTHPSVSVDKERVEIPAGETLKLQVKYSGEPNPEVSWLLNGQLIEESSRIKISKDDNVAVIQVRCIENVDAGIYTVRVKNDLGTVEAPITVKVLDVPSVPRNLHVTEITGDTVTLEWEPPEDDAGGEIIEYLINKRNIGHRTWQKVGTTSDLVYTVPNLIEENEYEFQVSAVNEFGVSEPAIVGPILVKYSDTGAPPGAPSKPLISDITTNSALLIWQPPTEIGRIPLLGYFIEQRTGTNVQWIRITQEKITKTTFTITELKQKETYEFRVIAVNSVAEGHPSEPSDVFSPLAPAGTPPGAPDKPIISDVKEKSATLSWEPPEDDGGLPILGYSIEKQSETNPKPVKIVCPLSKNTTYEITDTGEPYRYRVVAINQVGEGMPSEFSDWVTLQTHGVPPSYSLENDKIEIQAGETLKLSIKYDGEPEPSITWNFNGKPIQESNRNKITQANHEAGIQVKCVENVDAGVYTVKIKNDFGSVEVPITVKVLDVPSAPLNLHITDVAGDSVTIQWEPPADNGGREVIEYVIEKRSVGQRNWQKAGITSDLTFTISNLIEDNSYDFQVAAVNEFGVGEVATVGPATIPHQEIVVQEISESPTEVKQNVPGSPTNFMPFNVTPQSVSLKWNCPEDDGGSPIIGYIIKTKIHNELEWKKSVETTNTNVTITDLVQDVAYDFEICAKNSIGIGRPSMAGPIITRYPFDTPGAPSKPLVSNVTTDSATLAWEPPHHDGGSPILGYIVEQRHAISLDWIRITKEKIETINYRVTNLQEGEQYEFRVIATNKAGEGKPSEPSDLITAKGEELAGVAPNYSLAAKYRELVTVEKGDILKLDIPFTGTPIPTATWKFGNKILSESGRIKFDSEDNKAKLKIKEMDLNDSGTYTLILENRSGKVEVPVRVKVLDVPNPPKNVKVIDTTPESATLQWEVPDDDGGLPIIGYVIQRRSKERPNWQRIASTPETTYTAQNLLEGGEYYFQILAENDLGFSEPAETGKVLAKYSFNIPSPPGKPIVSDISTDSATLTWPPPETDGGSPILNYIIEQYGSFSSRWIKISKEIITSLTYKVTGLSEDVQYQYRIIAVNKAGGSEPSQPSSPFTIKKQVPEEKAKVPLPQEEIPKSELQPKQEAPKDEIPTPEPVKKEIPKQKPVQEEIFKQEPAQKEILKQEPLPQEPSQEKPKVAGVAPEYFLDAQYKDGITVEKGQLLKLDVSYTGVPQPTITWRDNKGQVLCEAYRIRIENFDDVTKLRIKEISKQDSGVYTLTLENAFGKVECPIAVKVTDVPTPPRNFKATNITPETITLQWQTPEDDGGSPILNYVLEKKGTTRRAWQRLIQTRDLTYVAINLLEGKEYEFRVMAENIYGLSEPAESGAIIAKWQFGKPGAPGLPEVLSVGKDSATLTWLPPQNDGGSPVTGYHVEKRQGTSPRWIRISKEKLSEPVFEARGLIEGEEYQFRVIAENKAGEGPPSEPSEPVACLVPIETKGVPEEVHPVDDEIFEPSKPIQEEGVPEGASKPQFWKTIEDISCFEGETVKFECEVTGFPKPTVYWLRNQVAVIPTDETRSVSKGDVYALVFKEAYKEDTGRYTVVAENIMGSAECSAEMEVKSSQMEEEPIIPGPEPPIFRKGMKDKQALEGTTPRFDLKVSGYPRPAIRWFKDGEEIAMTPDGKFRVIIDPEGAISFTIDGVTPDDAGVYSCVASNYVGETKTEGKLSVIEKPRKFGEPEKAPLFLQPLKDIEVIEGNPARFECMIAGNPHPDVIWSQEDHIIHPSADFRPFSDKEKCILSIRTVLPEDAGIYSVHISNPLGEAKSKAKLTVKEDPKKKKVIYIPPSFKQRFTDIEVVKGNMCKFECSVTGDPKPDITWYYNRRPLKSGAYRKIVQEGEYNALIVLEVGKEDRGEFICKASNAAGEATCTAELSVIEAKTISRDRESPPKDIKGIAPTFARKPRDCESLEGNDAFFDCRVLGTPDPEILWLKNGIELVPSEHIRFDKEYGGRHSIRLSKLLLDDAGEYTCIATNFAGRVSASAELRVDVPRVAEPKYPETDLKWKPPEAIEYDRRREDRGGAPWPIPDAPIISHMTDRHLRLSWKPSLPVAPRYAPISYIIEMCELPGKDWDTIKRGIMNPVCDVGMLKPGVDYKFRVRAENMYGISDPSPSAVTLRDKLEPNIPKPYVPKMPERGVRLGYAPKIPDIWRPEHEGFAEAPKFFRPEYDTQYGIDGEPVEIETWVYGYPTPTISWFFQNKKLDLSGRYGSSLLRTGQCILVIDKMTWDDVGEYECRAVNEHGDASIIVKLEMADPPVFIEPCIDTLIMTNESGRLDCRVTGIPYPEVKWLKDWHPLCPSTRIKIRQDEPDHCTLILNDAITRDSGLYTCQAKNLAGTALCSVTVLVETQASPDWSHDDVSYRKVRTKRRRAGDAYDIGDEIGRGTTAVVKRATEKATGHEYAAKIIYARPSDLLHMKREVDIMNQLNDKRLIRLHDAYERGDSLTLVQELATGGELLDNIVNQPKLTEREIADYIRQLLQGIAHMHEKKIVYIDLKPEDILISHPNSKFIKLCDFGLAHRLHMSEDLFVPYGTPEFIAPEVAKKYPVRLPADLWSVGVLSYLLLTGISPFLGDTDKETLENVIKGDWDFDRQAFSKVSDDAKDFIRRLLIIDYSKRMTAHQALDHPWLKKTDDTVEGLPLDLDRLRAYNSRRKIQLGKCEVSKFSRRRKLSACLKHPEGKLYPPEAEPEKDQRRLVERKLSDTSKEWMDLILSTREPGERDFIFQSESMYQQGPDTDLLQLRDPHMPVRIRQYMRQTLDPTNTAYYKIKAEHLAWGEKPAVKERRRILELLEEEEGLFGRPPSIEDQLAARRRKRQAIKEPEGYIPYFREKLRDKAFFEDQPVTFKVYVIGNPLPKVYWYRNDVILSSGERIKIVDSESGRHSLTILRARSGDVGVYKCVARNRLGESVCRSRLRVGSVPDRPPWPEVPQVSSTEAYVTWDVPRFDGNSPIESFKVEFRESNDEKWTIAADNIEEEFLVVKELEPLKKYRFRVAARNRFGWSPYTFSSEEIITLHEGAPRLTIDKSRRIKPLQHHRRPTRQLSTGSVSVSSSRRSSLDYNVEENPRRLNESNPEEKYKFGDEIKRGRFSVIRVCTDKTSDRVYAAKIIDLANQDRTLALQEFETMKALCNEHIIRFYNAFLHNDFLTLILERVRGYDILQFLSQKDQYTEEDVAEIITQVLDALQYLHFNGIAHLNLQPDNIVTVSRRRIDIRLLDFGSAYPLPADGEQLGRQIGHPEYMAPEIANKELVTYAADVWGVGVLAFILLSGHSPFRGDDERDTLHNVLLVRYRFQDLFSHITMESVRFIMQTLKRSPYNRPTVEECLDHKWLQPIDSVIRKRQRATFITSRIRRFTEEYRRQQDKVASNNNRLLSQYAPSH